MMKTAAVNAQSTHAGLPHFDAPGPAPGVGSTAMTRVSSAHWERPRFPWAGKLASVVIVTGAYFLASFYMFGSHSPVSRRPAAVMPVAALAPTPVAALLSTLPPPAEDERVPGAAAALAGRPPLRRPGPMPVAGRRELAARALEGSPPPPVDAAVAEEDRFELDDRVYFEANSAALSLASILRLQRVSALLKQHDEDASLLILGHTDEQGDDAYDMHLSADRASAVRAVLIQLGAATERIEVRNFGKKRPRALGHTLAAHAENRRIEFQIVRHRDVAPPAVEP